MKKNKGIQLGAVLAAMLLVSMALVSVVSAQDVEKRQDRSVVELMELQPEAGSDVVLGSLQAVRWSDGSVTIRGSGHKQVGDPAQYFSLETNISKKTYKTVKLDPSSVKRLTPAISKSEVDKEQTQNIAMDAISQGAHAAVVWVSTTDPVYERLVETVHRLEWTVYSGGTVGFDLRRVTCFAANPTSFGTHWYTDSCSFIGGVSYSNDYTSLFTEAEGRYHNDDWGFDWWATYADHWIKIQGKNDGDFSYWWDTDYSGEDWFILRTLVYTDGW